MINHAARWYYAASQRIYIYISKYKIKLTEISQASDQLFFSPVKLPVTRPRVSIHDVHEQLVQVIVVGRLKEIKPADIT